MAKTKADCESVLLHQVETEITPAEGVTYLQIVQTYHLERLRQEDQAMLQVGDTGPSTGACIHQH